MRDHDRDTCLINQTQEMMTILFSNKNS